MATSRMSGERPIELFWRYWTVPKAGYTAEQNEDACSVQPLARGDGSPGLLVAVADGATEAVYAGAWARALVAGAEPDWPSLSDAELGERIARVGRSFSPIEPGQQVPWFVRNKFLSQGSQATLLVAAITDAACPGSLAVSAVAVGDSCLLVFRADGEVAAFPVRTAAGFGVNPALVRNRFLACVHGDRWQGEVALGDVVVACTDAVGKWILQCLEAGQSDVPLEALCGLLSPGSSASAPPGEPPRDGGLARTVPADEDREEGSLPSTLDDLAWRLRDPESRPRMRNDDSTLVVCVPLDARGADAEREALAVVREHLAATRARRLASADENDGGDDPRGLPPPATWTQSV